MRVLLDASARSGGSSEHGGSDALPHVRSERCLRRRPGAGCQRSAVRRLRAGQGTGVRRRSVSTDLAHYGTGGARSVPFLELAPCRQQPESTAAADRASQACVVGHADHPLG